MKNKICFVVISTCLLVSCSKIDSNIVSFFSKSLPIEMHETPLVCDQIGDPSDMLIMDTLLVVLDHYFTHNLSLVDLKSYKHLMHFGPKGKGPGESINAICIGKLGNDGEFYALDDMKREIEIFSCDSLVFKERTTFFSKRKLSAPTGLYQALLCKDSLMVATINSPINRYGLFDKKGELIKSFGNYQIPPTDIQFPELANPLTFQCVLALNPNNKSFVSAGFKSGFLEIFSINGENIYNFHPKFPSVLPDITKTSRSVASLPDNIYGFIDIDVSEDFIYCLYSGRTIKDQGEDVYYSNQVLVFNWKGEPIVNLKLNIDIANIGVDENNHILYGFSKFPKLKLYFADLPNILYKKNRND